MSPDTPGEYLHSSNYLIVLTVKGTNMKNVFACQDNSIH